MEECECIDGAPAIIKDQVREAHRLMIAIDRRITFCIRSAVTSAVATLVFITWLHIMARRHMPYYAGPVIEMIKSHDFVKILMIMISLIIAFSTGESILIGIVKPLVITWRRKKDDYHWAQAIIRIKKYHPREVKMIAGLLDAPGFKP